MNDYHFGDRVRGRSLCDASSIMFYKREVIDVRVSKRILWVGTEAYPLQNIAGTPYRLLVSTDGKLVTRITQWIMDAIDNPQAEFQLQVENFQVGDRIQQFGNQNVGKVGT